MKDILDEIEGIGGDYLEERWGVQIPSDRCGFGADLRGGEGDRSRRRPLFFLLIFGSMRTDGLSQGAGWLRRVEPERPFRCGAPAAGVAGERLAPRAPALLNPGWGPPCHAGRGVAPQSGAWCIHVWRRRCGSHTKGLVLDFFFKKGLFLAEVSPKG